MSRTLNTKTLSLFALMFLLLSQTGCSSIAKKWKAFLNDRPVNGAEEKKEKVASFNDMPDYAPPVKRQYKRTTKESLAAEAQVDQKAGSLWVMEGQGAYLFSENIMRMVGDPLPVNIDGYVKEQLESKVGVIKNLIAKLEEKQAQRLRGPASEKKEDAKPEAKPAAAAANDANKAAGKEELAVKSVPTRIVERTTDGNYRVKGAQTFMIGSREYKVIVMGTVRAEDFNEDGVNSNRLLEPKFDIVSNRKKEGEM